MTLLALDASCPKCGTKPNLRVTARLLELVQKADPEHVLGTWECKARGCAERVTITVGSVQRATVPLTEETGAA